MAEQTQPALAAQAAQQYCLASAERNGHQGMAHIGIPSTRRSSTKPAKCGK
jgi:hypothetical protein